MNELIVVPDKKMPNLYRVKWSDGGDIANYLEGLYSTRISAKKKIMFYEARPKPQPIEYKGQKKITDEEEAELVAAVEIQVAEENALLENKNGKAKGKTSKNKD